MSRSQTTRRRSPRTPRSGRPTSASRETCPRGRANAPSRLRDGSATCLTPGDVRKEQITGPSAATNAEREVRRAEEEADAVVALTAGHVKGGADTVHRHEAE